MLELLSAAHVTFSDELRGVSGQQRWWRDMLKKYLEKSMSSCRVWSALWFTINAATSSHSHLFNFKLRGVRIFMHTCSQKHIRSFHDVNDTTTLAIRLCGGQLHLNSLCCQQPGYFCDCQHSQREERITCVWEVKGVSV